jgi:hypothetical protein
MIMAFWLFQPPESHDHELERVLGAQHAELAEHKAQGAF